MKKTYIAPAVETTIVQHLENILQASGVSVFDDVADESTVLTKEAAPSWSSGNVWNEW